MKSSSELATYYQSQAQLLREQVQELRERESVQGDIRAKEENAAAFDEAAMTICTRLFEDYLVRQDVLNSHSSEEES